MDRRYPTTHQLKAPIVWGRRGQRSENLPSKTMPVDIRQAQNTIKELLKHGTPKWVSHPEDYKGMVDEWHKEAQETLWEECRAYKTQDQEVLSEITERRVNPLPAAVFMSKLRKSGLTCFSHDSQLQDSSASLFVLMPTQNGGEFQPICSIQVPIMWEWTTLRIDPKTNLPEGFRDIGWRSAVRCLITRGALSERKAHEIFGKPREARVSSVYRRMLAEHRNGGKLHAA
jgi:hypothetical protein